jgi:hypothetical protein
MRLRPLDAVSVIYCGGNGLLELFLGNGGELLPAGGLITGNTEVGKCRRLRHLLLFRIAGCGRRPLPVLGSRQGLLAALSVCLALLHKRSLGGTGQRFAVLAYRFGRAIGSSAAFSRRTPLC